MNSVQLSISDITWRKLGEWGTITLPDVGTFYLQHQSARLDLVTNTVSAPGKKINYSEDIPNNSKYDIHATGVDQAWMEEQYALFLIAFKTAIDQNKLYYFPHIGTLIPAGSGYNFQPDHNSVLVQRGIELQQISFQPIARKYEKPESDAPLLPHPKRKKRSSLSRLSWLIIFVILNSILIFWLADKNKNRQKMDSLSVSLPDNRLNIKPSADAPFPDLPEIGNDSLNNTDTTQTDEHSAEDLYSNVEESAVIPAEKPEVKPAPAIPKKELKSVPQAVEKSGLKAEYPQQFGDCAIIVGSFREASNVDKMVDRIKNEGFEPFTEKGTKLTKVGILTSCEFPLPALEAAKAKFHPDAWIYQIPE